MISFRYRMRRYLTKFRKYQSSRDSVQKVKQKVNGSLKFVCQWFNQDAYQISERLENHTPILRLRDLVRSYDKMPSVI